MRGRGARGSASGLRQGSALHPRRVFDPLDTHLAIELCAFAYHMRVFMRDFAPAGATRGQWKQTKSAVALWTASRPHLSLLSAIATFLVGVPFVPYAALSTNKHETPKVAAPKVSRGRSQTSPVCIALWSPPQRRNPCKQKAILGEKSVFSPILRLHQHHRPQDTILIRVQTQRRIAPPRIIIRLPRA